MEKTSMKERLGGLLLGGALLFGVPARSTEAGLDVSWASKYLAGKAGKEVVDEPVVQTYLDIRTPLGTFYEWSNTIVDGGDTSEIDLGWVSPPLKGRWVGCNMTACGFIYPDSKDSWRYWDIEAGANIFSKDLPIDLNLYCGANLAGKDLSKIFKLTAGKSFKLGRVNSTLEGAVVYGDKYYSEHSGLSHSTLKWESSIPLGSRLSVYASCLGQKKLRSFGGTVKDSFVARAGARCKF